MATTRLADGFAPATEADWERLANRKDAAPGRLHSATLEGIPTGPLHSRGGAPVLAMRPPGTAWTIVQRVDHGDAAATAAKAVAGGATGIAMVFAASPAAYGRGLAADIDLHALGLDPATMLRVDAGTDTPGIAGRIAGGRVDADFDPLSALAAGAPEDAVEASWAGIAGLIEQRRGLAFAADGRLWHNGGAAEAQELGIALASAVAAIRRLAADGTPPASAAAAFGAILAADADQFVTIAKFRAARLLFARLAEVTDLPARPPIHAETSWRMLGRREPTMNMVRETTAAFAAATGGADSITVLSPLLEDDPFSDRMARNVQTILMDESSLHRVADPGAGSGAIEALTGRLAAAAWDVFARIEAGGGLGAAIRSGSILAEVAAMRERRLGQAASRALPLVGINVNIDRGAAPPAPPEPCTSTGHLAAVRLAAPFEAVAARVAGRTAPVRIAIVTTARDDGGLADAFAAFGFAVETKTGVDPAAAAEAAAALRAGGACAVIGAGAGADGLPSDAFDAIVTPTTDLPQTAAALLDRIADKPEKEQG